MDKEKTTANAIASPGSAQTSQAAARLSVLVVDDEENFLTLLNWYLTQQGYEVYTAASADEAFGILQGHPIDIALLDIKLGGRDGLSLLDQVNEQSPGVKVVMMTAYPTVSSIKQAFDKGAARYLTKPVDLQELGEALKILS
ncbi:MAG TPA: response regulator [Candidatus Binatia bacterium]|jgi:DNA-binding NtrC family response regulator